MTHANKFVFSFLIISAFSQFPASIVRMGVLNILASRGQLLPSDVQIESFIRHENFNSRSKDNDIAVIKMRRDVSLANPQKIRPACLWQAERINQAKAVATGWGHTQYAGSISDDLMKVQLDLLDLNECVVAFEDDDNILINRNKVCAGILAGGHDTCQGGEFSKRFDESHLSIVLLLQILVAQFKYLCPTTDAFRTSLASLRLAATVAAKIRPQFTQEFRLTSIGLNPKFGVEIEFKFQRSFGILK